VAVGRIVRSGDTLGYVDVLGVRQDVVAPVDGVLMRLLAEPGQAVEYGQGLAFVEAGIGLEDDATGLSEAPGARDAPGPLVAPAPQASVPPAASDGGGA
jgi:pyruvate/2-oxoglutarate dehydrogenase complex dihydrolipoamide acyltransferase (E2) component